MMSMTVQQIEAASLETVRTFVDAFALVADTTNPEHVDLLHAAKSVICREYCKAELIKLRGEQSCVTA